MFPILKDTNHAAVVASVVFVLSSNLEKAERKVIAIAEMIRGRVTCDSHISLSSKARQEDSLM